MSNIHKPKTGERVRVVYEGVASDADGEGFYVAQGVPVFYKDEGLVSIEKVEPPVVKFKPGDVVRSKDDKYLVALGGREYTYLANPHYDAGTAFPYGTCEGWGTREFFNSERFEKVEL